MGKLGMDISFKNSIEQKVRRFEDSSERVLFIEVIGADKVNPIFAVPFKGEIRVRPIARAYERDSLVYSVSFIKSDYV